MLEGKTLDLTIKETMEKFAKKEIKEAIFDKIIRSMNRVAAGWGLLTVLALPRALRTVQSCNRQLIDAHATDKIKSQ